MIYISCFLNKAIGLLIGIMLLLSAGCSFQVDNLGSKSEQYGEKADELGMKFEEVFDEIKSFEKKEKLSSEDQQQIDKELAGLLNAIDDFKKEEPSGIGKAAKKLVDKELKKKEQIVLKMQAKAKSETATKEDIAVLNNELKNDIDFNLFGKEE